MTGPEIYQYPVLIVPASSAKTLSPDMQFRKDTAVVESVTRILGQLGVVFDANKIAEDMFAHWDPIRTAKWIVDPKQAGPQGQPPVYIVLQKLTQQIEQDGQMIEAMQKAIQEVAKMAMAHDQKMIAAPGGNPPA